MRIETKHLITLSVLLACSTLLNITLYDMFRSVNERLEKTRAPQLPPLVLGAPMPELQLRRLDGTEAKIGAAGELPTLIYVFSPDCKWCQKNVDNIRAVARAAGGRFRLLGISLSGDRLDSVVSDQLGFPVFVQPSADTIRAYRLGATPVTIHLSNAGRVEHVWSGAYAASVAEEIESFARIRLPGLRQ
jgi:hypothetical protein